METEASAAAAPVIGTAAVLSLPKFWAQDPSLWFVQVENKFRLHRITSPVRQYELLVDALPPEAATEVRDILLAPLGENSYDILKDALVNRLVASEQRRLQQLLSAEELGDRRPTQFLRHLQHLLGDKASSLDAAILRELFLQRLPTAVRVGVAAAHRLTLAELAELADRMMEVAGPTINAAQTAPDVTSELTQLRKDLQKLTIEVANLRLEARQQPGLSRRQSRERSQRRSSPSSPRRTSPSPRSDRTLCRYHQQFGSEAHHCRAPCSWDQENRRVGR